MSNCGNPKCYHPKENHEKSICDGALDCMCEEFVVPVLAEFAAEIEAQKAKRWSIYNRVEYILKKIPQTRNAGEKTFYKIFIEIWYGFKIRVDGTSLSKVEWDRLPNQDSVNREKRRVKKTNPSLGTYDPKVIKHQSAIFQAYMDMAIEA